MTSKLYCFGDSFISDEHRLNEDGVHQYWWEIVAKSLDIETILNYGYGGSSLDYTYHQFMRRRDELTKDDIVIVTLTETNRKWLFLDNPLITNPQMLNNNDKLTQADKDFYERYFTDLHHDIVQQTLLRMFLFTLAYYKNKTGCTIIALDAFPHPTRKPEELIVNHGKAMLSISMNEFAFPPTLAFNIFRDYKDRRQNHMSPNNHRILAHKVVQAIEDKQPIDLGEGFEKMIVTEDWMKHSDYLWANWHN